MWVYKCVNYMLMDEIFSLLQTIIYYLLACCTGGFVFLVSYWRPDWALKIKCSPCSLNKATQVLLKASNKCVLIRKTYLLLQLTTILEKRTCIFGILKMQCHMSLTHYPAKSVRILQGDTTSP